MATMLPDFSANFFANATASSRFSSDTASATSASTPLVVPLPAASVLTSEIFPRITLSFNSCISFTAVFVRRELAPAPTGSSRTTCPNSLALCPAFSIPSIVLTFRVPILIFSPPQIAVISSTSCGSSDMIGLAPLARITFATSFTVT